MKAVFLLSMLAATFAAPGERWKIENRFWIMKKSVKKQLFTGFSAPSVSTRCATLVSSCVLVQVISGWDLFHFWCWGFEYILEICAVPKSILVINFYLALDLNTWGQRWRRWKKTNLQFSSSWKEPNKIKCFTHTLILNINHWLNQSNRLQFTRTT